MFGGDILSFIFFGKNVSKKNVNWMLGKMPSFSSDPAYDSVTCDLVKTTWSVPEKEAED